MDSPNLELGILFLLRRSQFLLSASLHSSGESCEIIPRLSLRRINLGLQLGPTHLYIGQLPVLHHFAGEAQRPGARSFLDLYASSLRTLI